LSVQYFQRRTLLVSIYRTMIGTVAGSLVNICSYTGHWTKLPTYLQTTHSLFSLHVSKVWPPPHIYQSNIMNDRQFRKSDPLLVFSYEVWVQVLIRDKSEEYIVGLANIKCGPSNEDTDVWKERKKDRLQFDASLLVPELANANSSQVTVTFSDPIASVNQL
jgi:hypothetical protein